MRTATRPFTLVIQEQLACGIANQTHKLALRARLVAPHTRTLGQSLRCKGGKGTSPYSISSVPLHASGRPRLYLSVQLCYWPQQRRLVEVARMVAPGRAGRPR